MSSTTIDTITTITNYNGQCTPCNKLTMVSHSCHHNPRRQCIKSIKNVQSSSPNKVIMFSIIALVLIIINLITVTGSKDGQDTLTRGRCPLASDIHPCICLLIPKHLDTNDEDDGDNQEEELVREKRESDIVEDVFQENNSTTTESPSVKVSNDGEVVTTTESIIPINDDEVSDIDTALSSDQFLNYSSSAQLNQEPLPSESESESRSVYLPPLNPPSSTTESSTERSTPVAVNSFQATLPPITSPIPPTTGAAELTAIRSAETNGTVNDILSASTSPTPTVTSSNIYIPDVRVDTVVVPTTPQSTLAPSTNPVSGTATVPLQSALPLTTPSTSTTTAGPTIDQSAALELKSQEASDSGTALDSGKSEEVPITSDHFSLYDSMLICRNMPAKVLVDALTGAKGYHFNVLILDAVRLPSPLPLSMFPSFDFLEMLNISSLQFRNNFKEPRDYFYGRTFRSRMVSGGGQRHQGHPQL